MSIMHLDAVARQLLDLGVDAHGVFAAAEVLVGEVLLHVLEHRAIEGLAGREAHVAQHFCRSSVLMSLLPLISNFSIEGRSTTTTRSVLPSRRSCTSRKKPVAYSARMASRDALLVEMIADVDRQVVEDRALGDALQALDADVADGEARPRRLRRGPGRGWRAAPARAGPGCRRRSAVAAASGGA